MKEKVLALLGSVRFWMVTLATASGFLGIVASQGFEWKTLFDTIATWLGIVAGIGTFDKVAQAVAGKDETDVIPTPSE